MNMFRDQGLSDDDINARVLTTLVAVAASKGVK